MNVRSAALVAIAAVLASNLASAPAAARGTGIDLRAFEAPRVVGAPASAAGGRVAAGGDVNGDGIDDILIGACGDSEGGPGDDDPGTVFVVSGGFIGKVSLEDEADYLFAITGADEGDEACHPAIGDVNGDGLADVIIGAPKTCNVLGFCYGTTYVVFGTRDREPVDLTWFDLGMQDDAGFRIDGPARLSFSGESVDGLGDINGDGLDDIGVTAPFAGSQYVVFGKTDTAPVDLASFHPVAPPGVGFRIRTGSSGYSSLTSINGVGDVNNDGVPDIAVGITRNEDRGRGSVYVIFGKSSNETIVASDLGDDGYRIRGARREDSTGYDVDGAGDMNGDGVGDLVIGAPRIFEGFRYASAYVVFGRRSSSTVQLAHLGSRGFRIRSDRKGHRVGDQGSDKLGEAVAGGRDVNGDGIPDVVLGAPQRTYKGRTWAGSAFVIYGKRDHAPVELSSLGNQGFQIGGARGYVSEKCPHPDLICAPDHAGDAVALLPDLNGDGRADILVGAPWAKRNPHRGVTYLVWGR